MNIRNFFKYYIPLVLFRMATGKRWKNSWPLRQCEKCRQFFNAEIYNKCEYKEAKR